MNSQSTWRAYRQAPIVLLVDEQQDSAALNAIGLLAMGFLLVTAGTAEDAFARACQVRPDVIVTDVTMTDASGVELTRRLRGDVRTRNVGIIGLTGQTFGVTKRAAEEAGCDRFVMKPCLPDVLALEIREVLNHRR